MFSITGYFCAGSKRVGRMMTPQMSVVPSRPFAMKASGARQPVAVERREVAAFELQRPLTVAGAAQLGHRRQVDARPGVDVELPSGEKLTV